jgi:hypothetical protein
MDSDAGTSAIIHAVIVRNRVFYESGMHAVEKC